MGPVNYNNRKLRFGAAFASGLYMLIHATNFNVYRAITSPRFYFVLAISCAVALILIEYVHLMTKKLDRRYGWRSQLSTRIIWQTIYGIIIPSILDLFLIGIYFHFLGENILDNGYFQIDFPMVIIFLLILNGYYFIHYHLLTEEREVQRRVAELVEENYYEQNSDILRGTEDETIDSRDIAEMHETSQQKTSIELADDSNFGEFSDDKLESDTRNTLTINHNGVAANFDVYNDIIYFYRDNRKMFIVTIDGNVYSFNMTIDELKDQYSHIDLCQINRRVVVNCNMISGYATGEKRGSYIVIFKPQFNHNIPEGQEQNFNITKEYIHSLKMLFEKI